MIVWKVMNRWEDIVYDRYELDSVYDVLIDRFHVTEEEAIEASSWCELACVGEVYQGEMFKIRVEEK